MQNLVPTDHLLSILLKDLEQTRVEVSLQRVIVLDPFLFHVRLDRRIPVPLFTFVLIATDVKVVVRKQRRHLAQKRLEEFVDFLARGIESGFKNTGSSFNRVWTRRASEFRITDQPARAVTGYIKLRNNANAAFARVSNDLFYLFLREVVAIGTELMKLGKLLALNAEALIFREVPVKDVQLYCRHRIEVALESFHRLKVTRHVDH